jgi:hypothetical protein
MAKYFRTELGPHFSEGARQVWLKMLERGWSLARTSTETGAGSGTLHKLLYGDRGVGRPLSMAFEAKFGVEQRLWDVPPTEAFLPPAAAADEPAQPSTGAVI